MKFFLIHKCLKSQNIYHNCSCGMLWRIVLYLTLILYDNIIVPILQMRNISNLQCLALIVSTLNICLLDKWAISRNSILRITWYYGENGPWMKIFWVLGPAQGSFYLIVSQACSQIDPNVGRESVNQLNLETQPAFASKKFLRVYALLVEKNIFPTNKCRYAVGKKKLKQCKFI